MIVNQKNKARALLMASAIMSYGVAFAQEVADTPDAAIRAAILKILAIIALAGAGYLTVASASVAWSVGAKFIKRLSGKA